MLAIVSPPAIDFEDWTTLDLRGLLKGFAEGACWSCIVASLRSLMATIQTALRQPISLNIVLCTGIITTTPVLQLAHAVAIPQSACLYERAGFSTIEGRRRLSSNNSKGSASYRRLLNDVTAPPNSQQQASQNSSNVHNTHKPWSEHNATKHGLTVTTTRPRSEPASNAERGFAAEDDGARGPIFFLHLHARSTAIGRLS